MPHTAASIVADPSQAIAELRRQLDELAAELQVRTAERDEALAREAAVGEVLQVINSSPGDLAPVFDAILDKARGLCGAAFGMLHTIDGTVLRLEAQHGLPPRFAEFAANPANQPGPGGATPRLMRDGGRFVHVIDLKEEEAYRSGDPYHRALVDIGGARTLLAVPLRKDGAMVGVINIYRQEVRPYANKQIALVESFAAQAVIAMKNARLLGELRERTRDLEEALEYQTATSDVLKVVSQSTFDLQPVLDTLVDTAARICRASSGFIFRLRDGLCQMVASFGIPEEYKDFQMRNPIAPGRGTLAGRIVLERRAVHLDDAAADPEYRRVEAVQLGRQRTMFGVPLMREDALIGVITLGRSHVEPFTEKQVQLVRTFADQAIIAIENVRLLNELRERTRDLEEALEYQTATSDVLRVISGSVFDLEPVLKTVVSTAIRLCRADEAVIYRNIDGEYRWAAGKSLAPEYERIEREVRIRPGTGTLVGRAALDRQAVHILDAWTDPLYEAKDDARIGGVRTMLGVPLMRDGQPIGVIGLARRRVEPYTDKEIELVRTFADQAVIAIENTRLLTELRESLEAQTATAEVLQVINSSPGDLAPVLDAMLDKALGLCGAAFGVLWTYDGERVHAVALRGAPPAFAEFLTRAPHPVGLDNAHARLLAGKPFVHIVDVTEDQAYRSGDPTRRALVELDGGRTLLAVPLRKDDTFLGDFVIYRQEVRPFSDREIALLQNFAAQAVIAMENARLIDEIRQRQAELRVTFDNMGDGVAMFDAELRLAAWNRNFQEILDLPDEFVAERPTFAEYFHYLAGRGEYASSDLETELRSRLDDPEREMRFERTRPDGRVIEVRRNPVPSGGFVMIYNDITARKRAEGEIRTARDAAEKALAELKTMQASLIHAEKMASLGQLTAGIAHEIKNPLNFVNNFAGLSVELLDELKEMAEPGIATLDQDTQAEIDETIDMLTGNLDKIAEHGRRADGIVQSMLAHSRGTSGERQKVDLNELVDEALNLAYHGARARDQSFNITLERDFASAIPPVELAPQDMIRVFINLISNGFHAAQQRRKETADPSFTPVLKVATRDLGDTVEVRVRDNGTGIPPEHRDKLFQPFFTTKPTGEGTGLGLSISYDIVTQQHGGTITVDSEPGVSTEFTVQLPRSFSEA